MAKPSESVVIISRRKSTVWTREKITQLIEFYRQHDCLWNHYTEAYKNKEKRTKAIEDICSNLRITKMDFGKKIHNLRNQFNSEMKKLERRSEDTGDDTESTAEGCRWTHFQALRFLRDVIEPRPGGYQSKIRKIDSNVKYDVNSEDETVQQIKQSTLNRNDTLEQVTQYQFEDATIVDDYEAVVAEQVIADRIINVKTQRNESTTSPLMVASKGNHIAVTTQTDQRVQNICNKGLNKVCKSRNKKSPQRQKSECPEIILEETQHVEATRCCHNSKGDQCGQTSADVVSKKSRDGTCMLLRSRDQWDAFGELIATEFRHLNSDISRKKLKRKIMQAMLEVGEEDDSIFV